jgi:hypothetical protein
MGDFTNRIVIDDALFGPLQKRTVKLELEGGAAVEKLTDDAGTIEAPPGAAHGWISIPQQGRPALRLFCALNPPPASSPAGLWQRLRNLGYEPPGMTDADAEVASDPKSLQMAIEEFQADHGLPLTGETDDATTLAVERAHDTDSRAWKTREWIAAPEGSGTLVSKKGALT